MENSLGAPAGMKKVRAIVHPLCPRSLDNDCKLSSFRLEPAAGKSRKVRVKDKQ